MPVRVVLYSRRLAHIRVRVWWGRRRRGKTPRTARARAVTLTGSARRRGVSAVRLIDIELSGVGEPNRMHTNTSPRLIRTLPCSATQSLFKPLVPWALFIKVHSSYCTVCAIYVTEFVTLLFTYTTSISFSTFFRYFTFLAK